MTLEPFGGESEREIEGGHRRGALLQIRFDIFVGRIRRRKNLNIILFGLSKIKIFSLPFFGLKERR